MLGKLYHGKYTVHHHPVQHRKCRTWERILTRYLKPRAISIQNDGCDKQQSVPLAPRLGFVWGDEAVDFGSLKSITGIESRT